MSFALFPHEEEPQLGFFHQVRGVDGRFEIHRDVHSQEFDFTYTLHLLTINVERGRCGLRGSRKIHNDLFGIVVLSYCQYTTRQMLYLLSVMRLLVV